MLYRKPFLLILFTLLILFILPSSHVHANDIDIINDPGTTGLWHVMAYDKDSNKSRAYVHMRFYIHGKTSSGDISSQLRETYIDHISAIYFNPSFDKNANSDYKIINAPDGFSDLNIGFKDNQFPKLSYSNITSIRINLYGFVEGNSNFIEIFDQDNNLLYEYNRSSETGKAFFSIYWESDNFDEDDFVVNVDDNYSDIKVREDNFYIVDKIESIHSESNTYKLFINALDIRYSFDVSFPDNIQINDFKLNDGTYNISFSRHKDIDFLYMQPDKTKKPIPIKYGTVEDPADLLVGFISINLTENTYEIIKNLKIRSIINKEGNAEAFAYLMFDIPIEDILNIRFTYQYRLKYFGFAGKWKEVDILYAKDDPGTSHPVWWLYLTPLTAIASTIFDKLELLNNITIKKVNYNQLPTNVTDRYISEFENIDINYLKNSTHYRIFLGQFSSFGSTNYDIKDSDIQEITYIYKGIVYNVPYDLINQDIKDPDKTPVLNELDFKGFFKFEGVNDFGTFLSHLFKYWKETIAFIIFLFVFFIIISFIFKTYSLFKYSFRHKGGYYR